MSSTGIAGFLPVHPRTYMTAWRNRQKAEILAKKEAEGVNKQEVETAAA